eukprot:TRINITY_DN27598_c0_g1_i1.p1 TRINITY_DN27598_c0_g1~~TRINITY_DN27598_c0_g1_i1.p1  ORF type:complete len:716 (+),score=123.59 TRINITY_DN27598_c0_g1_i1:28-2148(+)
MASPPSRLVSPQPAPRQLVGSRPPGFTHAKVLSADNGAVRVHTPPPPRPQQHHSPQAAVGSVSALPMPPPPVQLHSSFTPPPRRRLGAENNPLAVSPLGGLTTWAAASVDRLHPKPNTAASWRLMPGTRSAERLPLTSSASASSVVPGAPMLIKARSQGQSLQSSRFSPSASVALDLASSVEKVPATWRNLASSRTDGELFGGHAGAADEEVRDWTPSDQHWSVSAPSLADQSSVAWSPPPEAPSEVRARPGQHDRGLADTARSATASAAAPTVGPVSGACRAPEKIPSWAQPRTGSEEEKIRDGFRRCAQRSRARNRTQSPNTHGEDEATNASEVTSERPVPSIAHMASAAMGTADDRTSASTMGGSRKAPDTSMNSSKIFSPRSTRSPRPQPKGHTFLKRAAGRGAMGTQHFMEAPPHRAPPGEGGLLLPFLRGYGVDCSGRRLEDIYDYDFRRMERCHDYIQWLFPTDEASRFNLRAPMMTPELRATVRRDPVLANTIRRSLDKFCDFLGLEVVRKDEVLVVQKAPHFEERFVDCWRGGCGGNGGNHNWLRISRVLHCLRLVGLDEEAGALFSCLERLHKSGIRCGVALEHWRRRFVMHVNGDSGTTNPLSGRHGGGDGVGTRRFAAAGHSSTADTTASKGEFRSRERRRTQPPETWKNGGSVDSEPASAAGAFAADDESGGVGGVEGSIAETTNETSLSARK